MQRHRYTRQADTTARIGRFDQANGNIYSTLSINDTVKLSPDFHFDRLGRYKLVSIRGCCRQCLSSIPCADESCRRQRRGFCTKKCGADVIGGCECPPGREVCEGLCCGPGEVGTLDGCSPPNQVCNNHGGCLGQCLPEGCCPPHRVVCNNHCCEWGWSCASEGCCPPGRTVCNDHCCERAGAVQAKAVVRRECAVSLQLARRVNFVVAAKSVVEMVQTAESLMGQPNTVASHKREKL